MQDPLLGYKRLASILEHFRRGACKKVFHCGPTNPSNIHIGSRVPCTFALQKERNIMLITLDRCLGRRFYHLQLRKQLSTCSA